MTPRRRWFHGPGGQRGLPILTAGTRSSGTAAALVPRGRESSKIEIITESPAKPRRRWSYSLRTLFVVVTVAAFASVYVGSYYRLCAGECERQRP